MRDTNDGPTYYYRAVDERTMEPIGPPFSFHNDARRYLMMLRLQRIDGRWFELYRHWVDDNVLTRVIDF